MNNGNRSKRAVSLGLVLLLALLLAACGGKADKPDTLPAVDAKEPLTLKQESVQDPQQEAEQEPEPEIPFTDVAEDAYYYDAVKWALDNDITSGVSETQFSPASTCTRGQVVMFLWRVKGSPEPKPAENPFSDISSSDWYYAPALWAYENGVSTNTTFKPEKECTNAEILTFLWRAEGKPMAAVYSSPIALAASDAYYAMPVAWAENNGMFDGQDSSFDPAAPCLRADIVTYLYWAAEQWAFAEEDQTVQAEYEQIIHEAKLYEVHGSGLVYADYIDVAGDGRVELLTMRLDEDISELTVTIYANINATL